MKRARQQHRVIRRRVSHVLWASSISTPPIRVRDGGMSLGGPVRFVEMQTINADSGKIVWVPAYDVPCGALIEALREGKKIP